MRASIRSVWALVVVCFIAATGVQPARAGALREASGPIERVDTRSSLPAVTAAQPSRLLAALRERPAPPSLAVVPAPLLVQRFDIFAVLEATRGPTSHAAALFAIRSARGPPAR